MSAAPQAWRMEYAVGEVRYLEWFVATNYGIGHFKIRRVADRSPQITVSSEQRQFGWLRTTPLQNLRRHRWLVKMHKTSLDMGVSCVFLPQESINDFEKVWMLDRVFQSDLRARNAWGMLTGKPVGKSFEQIVSEANVEAAKHFVEQRGIAATAVSENQESWGMF